MPCMQEDVWHVSKRTYLPRVRPACVQQMLQVCPSSHHPMRSCFIITLDQIVFLFGMLHFVMACCCRNHDVLAGNAVSVCNNCAHSEEPAEEQGNAPPVASDSCRVCTKMFGMIRKELTCVKCLQPVCNQCSKYAPLSHHPIRSAFVIMLLSSCLACFTSL